MVNKGESTDVAVDIIVVGAGLVGLSAAIALHTEGKRVALVDAKANRTVKQPKTWDSRIYALTPATQRWLDNLGVWSLMNEARVNDVGAMLLWNDISEKALTLSAEDASLKSMACIVENDNLMRALWQKVDALNIPLLTGVPCHDVSYEKDSIVLSLENGIKASAALLVAADGANSFVRQRLNVATNDKPFGQTALVANYLAEKTHGDVARQWFAPHNTLALLPLPDKQVSMVWSVSTELATELLNLTAAELSASVQRQSQQTLGELKPVGKTISFDLLQRTAETLITDRVAFAGDAAHQIHPMAGQGANLGFRDVIALQAIIGKAHHLQDIGERTYLRQYARARKSDIASMNALTTGLDHLFAYDSKAMKKLTVFGMNQLNKHSIAKSILIKQATA